jgi:hypothetical protein
MSILNVIISDIIISLNFGFAGTVKGVDEETAFVWPVCGICENDLLIELGPNEYLCQNCNSSSQTSTKMSLEVFVSCYEIPETCKVKMKVRSVGVSEKQLVHSYIVTLFALLFNKVVSWCF